MKSLSLLIESAESLPFLGYYSEPQAYCVIKYKTQRKVSPISKISRNPFWMFQTELNLLQTAKDTPIQVYIYNSNSNAEDQLLGWTHILPLTMKFITLTSIKYQLHNIEGHRINSFVKISSKRLPHIQTSYFTGKQCIKVEMLNSVQIEKQDFSTVNIINSVVKFQYGNFLTGLKYGERNHITFPYNNVDQIIISLESVENIKNQQSLTMTFNVKNLKENEPQFFKLRFFDTIFPQLNYVACLVFTIIPNSNLPEQWKFMQISVDSDLKDNFLLRINSPLQTIVIKTLRNGKKFKLPNSYSTVTFDYFDVQKIDEKELSKQNDQQIIIKHLAKYQPIQSTEIQFNELQWSSTYASQFSWPIKKEKITKNMIFKFQALKQLKSGIKKIQPVNFVASAIHEKIIKLKQIKISSCYFYQVLPLESQLQVYHVDFYGNIVNFGSFTMKPNQSEYIIESRSILPNQGGELVFLCFQLYLKDDSLKEKPVISSIEFLENHMIFKVKTEKDKDIMSGKIIYNQFFISFAKKVSLTKLCKKFQQAVHNDALSIQPKFQLWIPFKKGLLELINCQFSGFQSFNSIDLTVGSDTKKFQSFGEQFLCSKSSFFYVENEKITLKMKTNNIETSAHYAFAQIFGNPENTLNEVRTYLHQIEIKGGKLKIWFKFTPLDDKSKEKQINLLGDQRLSPYSPTIPIKIGLKKFTILKKEGKDILGINPQNQLTLKIRMTHQSGHYESSTEKSSTGSFYFDSKLNHILTRASTNDEGRYIFISAQISETKSKPIEIQNKNSSDENQKQQRFYNSFIDITKILGKGSIEVKFLDNKTGKVQIICQFDILSQCILKSQLPIIEIQQPKHPKLCLKLNCVKLINNLKYLSNCTSYQSSLYKSIYSYFIMFIINESYHSLFALDSNTKFCEKSQLPIKESINNQFLLIDSKSIVKVKIIAKLKKIEIKQLHQKILQVESQMFAVNNQKMKQKLMELEVQVIGQKTLTFADLKWKLEDKQSFVQTETEFYANREFLSKYSNEQISIMLNSVNFTLTFDIVNNNPILKEKIFEIQPNIKYTQLSILKQCVGFLKINSIKPKDIGLMREILNGELKVCVNSEEINYLPLNNFIQSSVAVLVERSELMFSLSSKRNPQIIEKKVSLPSYLKTNQLWHHKVDIGNFIVSYSIECFSNGLTTFNQGRLILKDFTIMSGKVDKIKLNYPVQQNTQLSYFSSEKNVTGGKFAFNVEIEIQRKMKKILKEALLFQIFIESEKKKIMTKVYLCQLSISTKINQDNSKTIKMSFEDQIIILRQKNCISLNISGEYEVQKSNNLKQSKKTIKYSLLGAKQSQIIQVPQLTFNRSLPHPHSAIQTLLPTRQTGVKLQLQLPEKFLLYLQQANRQSILQNIIIQGINKDEVFTLIKSKQKTNIFYKYLDQLIVVKSLQFIDMNLNEKRKGQIKQFKIEMLNINQVKNSIKPVYKFILNENPQFILTVRQSSYLIPKAVQIDKGLQFKNQQSLIIQISVHKLLAMAIVEELLKTNQTNLKELSSQQKRLLSLKNSPNDEILTNKFCLYFKHGRQQQLLFGIDLQGNLTTTTTQISSSLIRFGYDAEDDQIDIFLCVENFWNKTQYNKLLSDRNNNGFFVQKYSYDEIRKKWIAIMPLNHYLIKISDIKKNNFNFSSIMKPYQYSLTQISLAKELYQRFQIKNVAFFGSFAFQQGYWGSLIVKINKIGPINFKSELLSSKNKNNIPKILCYMKISIQHKKLVLKQTNTEALQWIQGQYLSFKTFLSHLFLERKQQSQKKYLKFQMFIISPHSLTQKIFQKRYPLQDILSHELTNERVNISISQSDTNQLTEHFQIQVLFTNTKKFQNQSIFSSNSFQRMNLIQTSNQNVQQIDMISYKNKSFIDILKMILATNDKTHFIGYLNQVKESFIYQDICFNKVQSPFAILIILLPYLKTNTKFCFIDILQMLEIAITKNQLVIKNLDQIKTETNEPLLYNLFQSLILKDNKEQFPLKEINPQFLTTVETMISIFNEIKGKQTNIPLEKFFTKNNIQKLTSCIETHANLFNFKNISDNYLSQDVIKLMLSIISQIIQHSENFLQNIYQNIDQWIEFAAYKSLPILNKMIQVINKINLGHQTLISQQTIQKLMRILLDRKVQIDTIYQYWLKLPDFSKSQCFEQILSKYYLVENKQQEQAEQILIQEIQEIKRTKILRLFYAYLAKSLKRVAKSQNASRISQYGYQKQSDKGSIISKAIYAIDLNPNLIEKYQSLFQNTLLKNGNVLLLNAIVELIITWKELRALKEERLTFFLSSSKKYLEKDKKKAVKPGTQPNFNKMYIKQKSDLNDEQGQKLILNEKNKKSILQNLVKALTGKQKPNPALKQKNQSDKNSQGFSKYSKYLITR